MSEKIVCRVLTGPTASGKTELSIRAALDLHLDIVCMDSMQVYRRMDIGTAKPTAAERRIVPHHMLDIRDPCEPFSVSEYVNEAQKLVRKLAAAGREVLFVGGTGLYLQAMIHPWSMGNVPADEELRARLNAMAEEPGGREMLHRRLEAADPDSARRLPLNDIRRTIRAIEVSETTGIPFSAQPERPADSEFEWRIVSTAMERSLLYSRINRRVDSMIRAGLPDEVRSILREGVPDTAQSMCAIGYKELVPYVRGQCSLPDAVERIQTGSRHYAKRQMTFLRREPDIRYVDVNGNSAYTDLLRIIQ